MLLRNTLQQLAELTASQWGMVTTAQAAEQGMTRLKLSRLANRGALVRIATGVYRDAGTPADEHEDLRAAWLSTEPARLAEDRLRDGADGILVSGVSATLLHRVGDLRVDRHQFTTPRRRQSERPDIRYRRRPLDADDATIVDGLPTTTLERTIADLVEARTDLSLVADVLRDSIHRTRLDRDRLVRLLAPLAARNGLPRDDGNALLARLTELSGLDVDSLARRIASTPGLGSRVALDALERLADIDLGANAHNPVLQDAIASVRDSLDRVIRLAHAPQARREGQAAVEAVGAGFDAARLTEVAATITEPSTARSE